MTQTIEAGFMAFLAEGREGIGAVRDVSAGKIVVYVENAGEFDVPMTAVTAVHDQKVMLDRDKLDPRLLEAAEHTHDREDPKLVG